MNIAEKAPLSSGWDQDQLTVIEADSEARLAVEAGPGTGKTAVACARLAHLISEEDIEPTNTWMISFTRTAVAEIRARLHSYVGDDSFSIRIATVDSHAWSIHSGHDTSARLTGTYEENIERVIELLENDEDVADELSQIEHVVIDEAQDLVGQRADLIEALVKRLPVDCGVTVFADEAQAIYGFSDAAIGCGKAASAKPGSSLLDRLRSAEGRRFTTVALRKIHRTSSPGLRKIFSELRRELLDAQNQRVGLHAETAQKIRDLADRSGLSWRQLKVADFTAEDLLLFRTRAEVLMASQFCDLPHRLRLSGYGATLPSWLALCFFDFLEPFLPERVFLDLWSARVENKAAPEYGPADAWSRLLRIAGKKDGSVDMQRLRRRLSQNRPPVELALAEHGLPGPIVGTIHASKGREASNVVLLLPKGGEFEDIADEAEEARVLFVGATRARTSLVVGEGLASRSGTLSSGRVYGWTMRGKTMIETGRDGDISASGLVGRSEFSPGDAAAAQGFLAKVADVVTTYSLTADPDLDWRYRIYADSEGPCVGSLTRNITYDLWEILTNRSQKGSHTPPRYVNHVRGLGCSTIVLASDDSELEVLNEPWASSGFILAPKISAYPSFYFGKRKR
ncbi:UvrD-helicase domain-containing protein [Microbulbifer pacificus]|uniref:UvrD-helicase domain-containing protein n=1 Tax=Microbulbifer pacificus TaxID=407164 RepID=UPI000CF40973|nr:UvrD-helicase domain-containing protein [Microbulbifer pacificus]